MNFIYQHPLQGGIVEGLTQLTPDDIDGEEDIDLLNDETFGGGNEGWVHDDHEKLAELTEFEKCNLDSEHLAVDNHGGRASSEKLEDEEENLEKTLNELVEDELDDPAIMNVSRSIPIPGKVQQNLDEIFNSPTSPPALLDAASLVSPGHANIWGSPARDRYSGSRSVEEDPLRVVLTKFHSTKSPVINNMSSSAPPPFDDPSVITVGGGIAPHKSYAMPADVKTVQELEKELMQGHPKVKTLAEVERDILNQQGTAYATPPRPLASNINIGRGTPLQPVHGMAPRTVNINSPPPGLGMTPSAPSQAVSLGAVPPSNMVTAVRTRLQHLSGSYPGGSPHLPPNQAMMSPSLALAMGLGRGRISPPARMPFPPRMSPMHPRMSMSLPFTDPGPRRNFPHFSGPFPNRLNHHDFRMVGRGFRMPHAPDAMNISDRNAVNACKFDHGDGHDIDGNEKISTSKDPYAGIMTQKEKDWIIKIQLLQLQTSNPYLDDYYYTTYTMQKQAREKSKQATSRSALPEAEEPKLIVPLISHTDTRNYKPAQFEGSLGKVSVSSVNNPRQIIDAVSTATGEEDVSKAFASKEFRRHRQLLIDIEKNYNILLEIDDIEKQMLALPETQREAMLKIRKLKVDQLYKALRIDGVPSDFFLQLMCVRKGKRLVRRMLSFAPAEQALSIIIAVVKNLPIIEKKDAQDQVLSEFLHEIPRILSCCDMSKILEVTSVLLNLENRIAFSIIQSSFGASLIVCLVARSEKLYADDPLNIEDDANEKWSSFIMALANTISSKMEQTPAKPVLLCKNVAEHLERFGLDSDYEEQLKAWFDTSSNPEE